MRQAWDPPIERDDAIFNPDSNNTCGLLKNLLVGFQLILRPRLDGTRF